MKKTIAVPLRLISLIIFFLQDAAEFGEEGDDWIHSETEGDEFSSIKVRRRKLNCYNGCINKRTKYSVVVNIL